MAGVMSVKCACGWEIVVIMPEEEINLLQFLFWHLKQAHGIELPEIQMQWH